jgi:RNA polymerase sigma factor (sigma-70 family)
MWEMRASTKDTSLVVAAQAGDRRALDELVTAYLPLVYSIVRRALVGHHDIDDIVQDTMLRAVRDLRTLRTPESFRAWLASIAVRQVGTHLNRNRIWAKRSTGLDEAADLPDADADFEGLTALRVEISHQRMQVGRASRWLDPDDRALLSLWWLETAGLLTRPELAAAMGLSVAHAGVRVQRMRGQLEVSRSLVAALDAVPRCALLDVAVASWDGRPGPLWRKRIVRHTRSCTVCERVGASLVATERLLVGYAVLPVPIALTATLAGEAARTATTVGSASTAGVKAGILSQITQSVAAHPIVAAVATTIVVAGAVVTVASWPSASTPPVVIGAPAPTTAAPPSSASGTLSTGPASLESANEAGQFVAAIGDVGVLLPIGAAGDDQLRRRATFEVVAGLADPGCFSFRSPDGRYLRHASWQLRLHRNDGTLLFRRDATFCVRAGSAPGSVSLESSNYPGWFLRHRGDELWVDRSDGTPTFRADSSFKPWSPLAR